MDTARLGRDSGIGCKLHPTAWISGRASSATCRRCWIWLPAHAPTAPWFANAACAAQPDLLPPCAAVWPRWALAAWVASFATEAEIADLCDVSLLDRLRNSDFLADVLAHADGGSGWRGAQQWAIRG